MSSNNKTASRGGKGAKGDKSHKAEKLDTGKTTEKQQSGGGDNVRSKADDPSMKEKVKLIMDMTQRSEAEVCSALHDCDNDAERAADMLFENNASIGEWETTMKKKKNRQPSASKAEGATEAPAGEEWNDSSAHTAEKEKPRNKTGGPPRLHGRHNDSRGWRGREKQENERNLEDGGRHDFRERRGRSGGPTRGTGGGRGRGGGRAGGRYPPRGNRGGGFNNSRPIDTWDSNTWDNNTANTTNHIESWDDLHTDEWSAEEYTGSLADTKVFTPSIPPEPQKDVMQETKTGSSTMPGDGVSSMGNVQPMNPNMDIRNQLPLQTSQLPSQSPVPMVTALNAAQTQYLSQLTQQNSINNMADQMKVSQQYGTSPVQSYSQPQSYNTSVQPNQQQQYSSSQQYGGAQANSYVNTNYPPVNNAYGSVPEPVPTQQTVRTKTQRARVPPPSKIPSSAVEMPGDLKNIGCLDLQFGAMDIIGDNNSFDSGVGDGSKFGNMNSSGLENSAGAGSGNLDLGNSQQTAALDAYSPSKPTQSSISSALSQSLSNTDSIPQTSEHLAAGYNTARTTVSSTAPTVTASGLDMSKQQADSHSYSQSSNYNSYQSGKSSSYQGGSYNSSSSYSATQVTTSSYVGNQQNNYVNSNPATYNAASGGNAYQNTYSSNNSYQSSSNAQAFPSMSQANSYPSANQGYQQSTSQSVYGASSGLNNSSSYATSTSGQYNSYNSSANHKLGKDSGYDSGSVAASSSSTSTTGSASVSSSLTLTQTTATGTKATTTLAKNSSSVVSNIPPGVTPIMSTPYIMNQGIPYFQQPVYTYEDMQLIQQRIPPHMTTPFYDMSYQTPTTLTAVRDGALATYSMPDARFTRTDNNASPVPSTLSQQTSTLTQGHQAQPMLPQTAGPFYYAPWQPASYQISAVYSQMPTATNAHGTSNSSQYPKPGTYGSGYGSGYDALTPSQDYTKTSYVGNTQGQSKASGGNASSTGSSGNDLSAMYGKSHTALGKVNSYDKQGFHSGTPPPFTGALHGSQSAGLAPSGTGYPPQMFIPAMAPHQQHHSTQLMHQPLHQDSSNSGGQRSQSSNPSKTGAKQGYPSGYWNQS